MGATSEQGIAERRVETRLLRLLDNAMQIALPAATVVYSWSDQGHPGLRRDGDISMARMNARMMRTQTALEIAAELYTKRAADLGNAITITMKAGSEEPQVAPLRIGINGDRMGGMKAPIEVGNRRVDIAYVNPSPIVTMAYRGKGFYEKKMPLRALASFPSWDRMAFVVRKELHVKSLVDLARRKIPLRVSTRASGVDNTTRYTVSTILSLYGLSLQKIKR
jgi:hypothetical protein